MLIFVLFTWAHAGTITGEVFPPKAPSERKFWSPATVKVYLNDQRSAYLDASNTFTIFNVPDGVYLLETVDPVFAYKTFIIEVSGEIVHARDPNNFKGDRVVHPLRIQTERQIQFFEQREPFSIMSIFMNPMILMTGVMLGVTFFMPKMKLDPEQMTEMREMQKQMNSGWMSSFLNPPS